jgi:heme exporter protein D
MTLFNTSQFAAFINGAYAVSVIFLAAVSALTLARYRNATRRLAQTEANK